MSIFLPNSSDEAPPDTLYRRPVPFTPRIIMTMALFAHSCICMRPQGPLRVPLWKPTASYECSFPLGVPQG